MLNASLLQADLPDVCRFLDTITAERFHRQFAKTRRPGMGYRPVRAGHCVCGPRGGHAHDRDTDTADISPTALAAANRPHEASPDAPDKQRGAGEGNPPKTPADQESEDATTGATAGPDAGRKANGQSLTHEEQKQVQDLKENDRETRTHEQAHKNAAGAYAQGGPVFEFQQGPDGRRYAVGGHVNIDTSEIPGDPQATIQKMQVVRRAALAPSSPSEQDRKVAAQVTQAEQKARTEMRQTREDNEATSHKDRESETSAAPGTFDATDAQGLLVDLTV